MKMNSRPSSRFLREGSWSVLTTNLINHFLLDLYVILFVFKVDSFLHLKIDTVDKEGNAYKIYNDTNTNL